MTSVAKKLGFHLKKLKFYNAGCDANDSSNSSSSACAHSGGTATCTEAAVCELCGESYGEALGHSHATEWTADENQHWHACACGDKADLADHTWVEGTITDPTCTEKGAQAYTCECGASKSVEIEALGHIDENLDIDCDREGCTSKVAPPADSVLSTFTANCLGSKLSTSGQYYVVGTIVEVLDAKNGIFLIDDGTGETFYFRLPKNAEGVSHSSWTVRLTLGDKVQVYGKINKYTTTTAPNGQFWPAIQSGVVTVLEQHEHVFEPTCTKDGVCACLTVGPAALGHVDEDANGFCDRCEWNMNLKLSNIVIATDSTLANGVQTMGSDGKAAAWTWSDDAFDVIIAKGSSTYTLYTSAKAYMQLKKQNTLTVVNKNNATIKTITIFANSASQFAYLEAAMANNDVTFTKDADNFSITVEWNSTEDFVMMNNGGNTAQICGVEVVYE